MVKKLFNIASLVFISFFIFSGCSKKWKDGDALMYLGMIFGDQIPGLIRTPPTINDTGSPYTFTTGITITNIVPATTGIIQTCSITPALPDGLTFNTKTCIISGTPSSVTPQTPYTITVKNAAGSASVFIFIEVISGLPTITYNTSYTFYQGVAITTVTPVITGYPINADCALSSTSPNDPLPTGLTIDPATCEISGTPTALQTAQDFIVTVTNASGSADSNTFSITVNIAPPTLDYATPFTFTDGVNAGTISPTTITGSPTCAITGTPSTLPTGLTLNADCTITGTPSGTSAAANYTIRATNGSGSVDVTINITVDPAAPVIEYNTPFVFQTGAAVNVSPTILTGTPVITCSISPSLPSGTGLTFNTGTCTITGTATGTYNTTTHQVTATNAGGSDSFAINITINPQTPTLIYGGPYTFTRDVSVGTISPTTLTGTPLTSCTDVSAIQLPPGLVVNNTTCAITGTPTVVKSGATYTIRAVNASGSVDANIVITVNPPAPTISYAGNPFLLVLNTDVGTISPTLTETPLTACSSSPALPSGLTLNPDCTITGTPTAVVTQEQYVITATNAGGNGSTSITITVDRLWVQDAYFKASNSDSNDQFGGAVSIDGNYAIVGAKNEDSNQTGISNGTTGASSNDTNTDSGAAYIYYNNGGNWEQDAYLKASNNDSYDEFGTDVSISGNFAIVSAVNDDSYFSTPINNTDDSPSTFEDNSLSSNSGAAYIFFNNSGTWIQDAYLKASNSNSSDQFGYRVGISGNFAVVSSIAEQSSSTTIFNTDDSASTNNTFTSAGAVYVFKYTGGNWIQDAYLKPSNTDGGDKFGSSIAIDANTIIVGSPFEDSDNTSITNTNGSAASDNLRSDSGAVYIFKRDTDGSVTGTTGNWYQDAYFKASNSNSGDSFGNSVDISGNYAVVGSELEDSSSTAINNTNGSASADNAFTNTGAAYIFYNNAGTWVQDAYLKPSNNLDYYTVTTIPKYGLYYGKNVTINAGFAVVTAAYDLSDATGITNTDGSAANNMNYRTQAHRGAGALFIYKRNSLGDWIQDAYVKASNNSVISGTLGSDLDINSGNYIIAGSFQDEDTASSITNTDGEPTGVVGSQGVGSYGASFIFKLQ